MSKSAPFLGPLGEPYTIEQWKAWTGRCGELKRSTAYGSTYCMRVAVRRGRCGECAKKGASR